VSLRNITTVEKGESAMIELDETLQGWLSRYLAEVGAVAGTVHLSENGGLRLAAAVNIPDAVLEAAARVPSGKGMAGGVYQRGQAFHTPNLREDTSGVVPSLSKTVNAQAAVVIPVQDRGGRVTAVVGVAFSEERDIPSEEIDRLTVAAVNGFPTS
jgi:L-methionine (R)-S-oxide reductase